MRAIAIARPGGPDVLTLCDVPEPAPGRRSIRVRVHATAVNRADLLQRAGAYPAPADAPQDIPGLEYAGTVDAVGTDVTRWQAGDRVMGLVGGGSYAEYVVTHEDEAVRVPDNLTLEQAAAVPEAFITAHDALFARMQLRRGESLVIHAVGSGVGTAALQIAKAHDAFVLGTQRSTWKLERARELGLDVAIDTGDGDWVEHAYDAMRATQRGELRRATPARCVADSDTTAGDTRNSSSGIDGILDLVGGDYLGANLRAIRVLGRIVVVGLVAGARSELDMRMLLKKRATIIGTVLRARPLAEKIDAVRAFATDVVPLLASGAVQPIIDRVLPLEDAALAHQVVAGNETCGKVILTLG